MYRTNNTNDNVTVRLKDQSAESKPFKRPAVLRTGEKRNEANASRKLKEQNADTQANVFAVPLFCPTAPNPTRHPNKY